MRYKTALLLVCVPLFFVNICRAGELVVKEAVNYFNEGVRAQKFSNFQVADLNYKKVILLDPYNPMWQKFIFNNRGVIAYKLGNLESAEALFNEALKIDPNYEAPKLNLGFIYELRRSKLESMEYWLKVLKIDLESAKPKGFVITEEQK